ncbi:MAG: hypothetical protein KJ971_06260 [Firmicutes bacterium]|nr:hypothetical protein [Bacillota bacterium]
MIDLQTDILNRTKKEMISFRFSRVLVSTTVFSVFVISVFLIGQISINWISGPLIVGISFVYCLLKEYFMKYQNTKMLSDQLNYLKGKKPKMTLFISMLEVNHKQVYLKKSSLFIENNRLYLEAYHSNAFSFKPKDSITVSYGKDFILKEVTEEDLPLVSFKGILMDTEYQLLVVNNQEVITLLKSYIKEEEKDV